MTHEWMPRIIDWTYLFGAAFLVVGGGTFVRLSLARKDRKAAAVAGLLFAGALLVMVGVFLQPVLQLDRAGRLYALAPGAILLALGLMLLDRNRADLWWAAAKASSRRDLLLHLAGAVALGLAACGGLALIDRVP